MRTYYITIPTVNGIGHDTAVLVIGTKAPDLDEKLECLETVTRLVDDGWTIAAHGSSVIGELANRAAQWCDGRFVDLEDRGSYAGASSRTIRLAPRVSRAIVLGGAR